MSIEVLPNIVNNNIMLGWYRFDRLRLHIRYNVVRFHRSPRQNSHHCRLRFNTNTHWLRSLLLRRHH